MKANDQKRRKTRKLKKPKTTKNPLNSILIPAHVSNYLYFQNNEIGDDFYSWVNKKWLKKTSIPQFESDFGVSEEVERIIFKESKTILEDIKNTDDKNKDPDTVFLKTLSESCLHSRSQESSVLLLKQIIHTLDCIKTKEDVMYQFGVLCKRRFHSLFILQYTVDSSKKLQLLIDGNTPSLPLYMYSNRSKFADYKLLLHKAGELLDCPNLHKVAPFEKSLVFSLENTWSSIPLKTSGKRFANKFSKIPWDSFFQGAGIDSWKEKDLYYKSPVWIRHIGKLLHTTHIEFWKLLIARSYIVSCLKYLPPPFDELDHEFFSTGQTVKTPQMELLVNIVYSYLPDLFSRVFWEKAGSPEVEKSSEPFVQSIVQSAKHRLSTTDWLSKKACEKGVEKIDKMRLEIVKPKEFPSFTHYELDNKNLLHNLFLIAEKSTENFYKRMDHLYKVWEEGIYRVNAYYFNENNEIMIPYGTMISPFYSVKASDAWNYGALGSIIGHEICHGFDEDGKDYDAYGQRKKWWTRADNLRFNYKKKALIELYSKQTVLGKKVNGKKTLSENIADLGGLGIALHALKERLKLEEKPLEEKLAAYREFFIAFATSWRTKYRDDKLKHALEVDRHSPAFLRVNLIVSQFDEWYDAFAIEKSADLYIQPDERIRIF